MSDDPVLVIQLRRLGDIILTFPLLLDLAARFPKSPIWVAGEPDFFLGVMPFAPNAVFFPPDHLNALSKGKFKAIINLSGRQDAALCAGHAGAEIKIGPVLENGALRIHGFWQLYRACLTCNNRHNIFHWADLNRLDLGFPLRSIQPQRQAKKNTGLVPLFIGASDPSRRPESEFWIALARRLLARGLKPMLLGGEAEKEQGELIASQTGLQTANFCGKTTLKQLRELLLRADLLITPDTGPMHFADWLGVPVLNLAMGPAQPWETGPQSAGQWIAQAAMSCSGCWQCQRHRLYCKNYFNPSIIAALAFDIINGNETAPARCLSLWRTERKASGLRELIPLNQSRSQSRLALGQFWQSAFLYFSGCQGREPLADRARTLFNANPALANSLCRHLDSCLSDLIRSKGRPLPDAFWKKRPYHSRLFAGFTQMALQNEDYSPAAQKAALERAAALREIFAQV